jgi:hypothetical protein
MQYSLIDEIPKLCFPIKIKADVEQLKKDVNTILSAFNITQAHINEKCKTDIGWAINLTHLPGLTGNERVFAYTQQHDFIKEQDISETDFSTILTEIKNLYIGKLISNIFAQHGRKFQGRCQLVWLSPKRSYDLHLDQHTPHRYHIPIITNEQCYWHFRYQKKDYNLHMAADGTVWYLNPVILGHNFFNNSDTPRLHLILTSGF